MAIWTSDFKGVYIVPILCTLCTFLWTWGSVTAAKRHSWDATNEPAYSAQNENVRVPEDKYCIDEPIPCRYFRLYVTGAGMRR